MFAKNTALLQVCLRFTEVALCTAPTCHVTSLRLFTEFHLPSSLNALIYAFSCSNLRCRGCSLISMIGNALRNSIYANRLHHRCAAAGFVRVLSGFCHRLASSERTNSALKALSVTEQFQGFVTHCDNRGLLGGSLDLRSSSSSGLTRWMLICQMRNFCFQTLS